MRSSSFRSARPLSPRDDRDILRAKCRWYVEQGSHAVLLLDPDAEIAEYFGPARTWEAHVGTRVLPLADILPGLDLTPEAIFAILRHMTAAPTVTISSSVRPSSSPTSKRA